MKKNTHPKWYPEAVVTCVCGHTFKTGSTQPHIQVEICSKCHPFYTGKMKYVDTMGRVEKFQKKQKKAVTRKKQKAEEKKKQKAEEKRSKEEPKTLKEMLQAIR